MTDLRSCGAALRRAAVALSLWSGLVAAAPAPAYTILSVPATANLRELPEQLARWRQDGTIIGAQLLEVAHGVRSAAAVPPNPTLGTLAILEFADATAQVRWEKSAVAALADGGVATRVDLLAKLEVAPHDSPGAVFLISEYDLLVPSARYREYVDGYVMPQLRAWRDAGVITGATMFAAREPTGAPFHAILVLEHPDAAAFAKRDAVKGGSRQTLAADPAWQAFSEAKAGIRIEKFLTRAVAAPVPAR